MGKATILTGKLYINNKHLLFMVNIRNLQIFGWRAYKPEKKHVVITGSNASLLSRELGTRLTGRHLKYELFPFSFKEFLSAKKFEIKNYYSSSEKALLNNLLNEFLIFGGYPEAVIYDKEREKIIKDIYDTAIYKDVIEGGKIRNTKVLRLLIKALLTSNEP